MWLHSALNPLWSIIGIVIVEVQVLNWDWKGECDKEQRQPKTINGSSTERENPVPGDWLQLAPQQKCVLVKQKLKLY